MYFILIHPKMTTLRYCLWGRVCNIGSPWNTDFWISTKLKKRESIIKIEILTSTDCELRSIVLSSKCAHLHAKHSSLLSQQFHNLSHTLFDRTTQNQPLRFCQSIKIVIHFTSYIATSHRLTFLGSYWL